MTNGTITIEDIAALAITTETSESVLHAINEIATAERDTMAIWEAPTDAELAHVVASAKKMDDGDVVNWGEESF